MKTIGALRGPLSEPRRRITPAAATPPHYSKAGNARSPCRSPLRRGLLASPYDRIPECPFSTSWSPYSTNATRSSHASTASLRRRFRSAISRRLWLVDDHSDADSFASVKAVVARLAARRPRPLAATGTRSTAARARRPDRLRHAARADDGLTWSSSRTPTSSTTPADYERLMAPLSPGADARDRHAVGDAPAGARRQGPLHAWGNGVLTS